MSEAATVEDERVDLHAMQTEPNPLLPPLPKPAEVEVFDSGEMLGRVQQARQEVAGDEEAILLQPGQRLVTNKVLLLEAKAAELDAFYSLALKFAKTSTVRAQYRWNGDPGNLQPVFDLTAAMMFGDKLGIEPEDAGQLVFSMNGIPSVEAKTMVAIVRRWIDKRIAEGRTDKFLDGGDWIWEVESDANHCVWAVRRDGDEKIVSWDLERAKTAGYAEDFINDDGTVSPSFYSTIPTEMLRWRCASEAARLMFSDVLRGIQYSKEELELVYGPERPTRRIVEAEREGPKGIQGLLATREARASAPNAPEIKPEPGPSTDPQPSQPDPSPTQPAADPPPSEPAAKLDPEIVEQLKGLYRRRGVFGAASTKHATKFLKLDPAVKDLADIPAERAEELIAELT